MRIRSLVARLVGRSLPALAAFVSLSVPSPAEDGPIGVVYVQSNVAGPNANGLFGFRRDSAGHLTPLKGSPFPTGGSGISPTFDLGPYDSDQEIIAAPGGLLMTTNGGSDTIAVLKVGRDGSLRPVPGSPFPSGGTNPVSLGLRGDVLTVVNKDMDPGRPGPSLPNYTTLRLDGGGRLTPTDRTPQLVDLGASPTQALVAPDSPLIFGCDFLGGTLRSFRIRGGGLVPVDVQGAPAGEFADSGKPPLPLGLAAHPTKNLFYVGFVTINRMGVYRYHESGRFHFVRSVNNSGQGLCWILVRPDGGRIYTSNTADNSVSVYDSSGRNAGEPIEIQKVTLKGQANAYQIALDPSGKFFYVVTQRNSADLPDSANALHVLSVDGDGLLSEIASSPTVLPVPEGTRPQGVIAF